MSRGLLIFLYMTYLTINSHLLQVFVKSFYFRKYFQFNVSVQHNLSEKHNVSALELEPDSYFVFISGYVEVASLELVGLVPVCGHLVPIYRPWRSTMIQMRISAKALDFSCSSC